MQSALASPARSPLSSPGLSPSFRHARSRIVGQSPLEIKERMRKCYKERIHNSRNIFFNRLRDTVSEADLRDTLSRVLGDLFHREKLSPEDDEYRVLEAISEELVQAEMSWLLEEYEKANFDNIDWASLEPTNDIICPTCQKVNLVQHVNEVTCPLCTWSVLTSRTLPQLKTDINTAIEHHALACSGQVQFTPIGESSDIHIYLICNNCSEMRLIL